MAATEIRPIRTKQDYDGALKEVERLWGAKLGTPEGDRLDVLATLIDAYEAVHEPMDPPDPIEAIKFRMEQQGLHVRISNRSFARGPGGRSVESQAQPVDRDDSWTEPEAR